MIITAIIAEYNPFHDGHYYQIQKARELTNADYIIAIMSGDFIQRGGPAFMNKYARTQMALTCGIDMVLELPVLGATSSAEVFASSAVAILNQLGCIDYLCFGAETDHIDQLTAIAGTLASESDLYKETLQTFLRSGFNFPTARARALEECIPGLPVSSLIETPNNILAIEYLKALIRTQSKIKPCVIKRIGSGYHSDNLSSDYQSASAIRRFLINNENDTDLLRRPLSIPYACKEIIHLYKKEFAFLDMDHFDDFLLAKLMTHENELISFMDFNEELANRIKGAIPYYLGVSHFIDNINTKNVTRTRISRCLMHLLLDHKKETFETWRASGYASPVHILGFRKNSSHLLKELKQKSSLPVYTNPNDTAEFKDSFLYEIYLLDLKASMLYRQILQKKCGHMIRKTLSEPVITVE